MKTARKKVVPHNPEMRWGHPNWCHHHGSKMLVEKLDLESLVLVISGSAARVIIKKVSSMYPRRKGWFVDWEIVHCAPYKTGVRGRSWFEKGDLAAAFGLSKSSGKFGGWLIERFGADSAEQGKYIRWGNFLNIPCPGTGNDGDPNVSIHLDEGIRRAVSHLIGYN